MAHLLEHGNGAGRSRAAMQEYRDYYGPEGGRFPSSLGLTPAVWALLIATLAVFCGSLIAANLLGGPARLFAYVGFAPALAIGSGWVWQIATYSFFHDNLLQLLFTALGLYFFGREVESIYGTKKFLILYFGATVAAAAAYALGWPSDPFVGAAGVYALLLVFALHYPRQKVLLFFILPIEVWLLVAIILGFDFLFFVTGGMATWAWAHFAAAGFGWVFFRYRHWLEGAIERVQDRMARREVAQEEELEARLDSVLQKINREGMASLTKKDWEILKKASRHYQGKS